VNASGGIAGRRILVEVFDDAYAADETVRHVGQLIGDGDWFAVTTSLASSLASSAESLGAACVPHPLVLSGTTEGIAGVQPFTIPWQLTFATEIELAIKHSAESWNEPGAPRVAALVMDNDFGQGLLTAATAAIEQFIPDAEVVTVLHDPAAYALTTENGFVA